MKIFRQFVSGHRPERANSRWKIVPSTSPHIEDASNSDLNFFLNYIFGTISCVRGRMTRWFRALTGKDAIVLLPTAHGKSIAFQLAAMLLPGVTIVVDPILALMTIKSIT